ncbi:MAG: Tol-Pal system beta propeller repeat protein TolB [candidate division Zixibacteria bacterium]|nr:Tol-Pal system beta propeller repeat protein TolB [candidate division Zixibacteria bacterium]
MKTKQLIFLSMLLVVSNVSAQDENIRNIPFDTIRTGEVRPRTIAVEDMKYVGTNHITKEDTAFMRAATGVVQSDIEFASDFELTEIDSFYIRKYEIKEMDALAWNRLGADYLVRLEAEFMGANMRVRWRLTDTKREQEIGKGMVENSGSRWREIGHDIANDIVRTLTGDRGIFRTRIAYCKKIGKGKEICIADFDGSNEQQITFNGSINISPCWTPDGREVYYTTFVDGPAHIYKVDITTRKTTRIAAFTGINAAPAVSPDGTKLACVLSKDGNSEIYVLDLSGRMIKRVTISKAIESGPTWSPDSRLIAFTSDRTGSPQIYTSDADGINTKRLTFEGRYNDSPIWSLRGTRVTFVSRTPDGRFDLASIDTSGNNPHLMTGFGQNENPHFSPDGKHIVFASTRLGGSDIFVMDASGRNQRRITTSGVCSNPTWGPYR